MFYSENEISAEKTELMLQSGIAFMTSCTSEKQSCPQTLFPFIVKHRRSLPFESFCRKVMFLLHVMVLYLPCVASALVLLMFYLLDRCCCSLSLWLSAFWKQLTMCNRWLWLFFHFSAYFKAIKEDVNSLSFDWCGFYVRLGCESGAEVKITLFRC